MSDWNELGYYCTIVPLDHPLPGPTFDGWRGTPFTAKWSATAELFARECRMLEPTEVVIEAGFERRHFRADGLPRGDARPAVPGIVVHLVGTPHGDLRYEATAYHDWQSNLRAVALTLESLRAVDRYGVTKRGEQYVGSRLALEAGAGDGNAERGRRLIEEAGSVAEARRRAHPDHGGDEADFRDVQAAIEEDE